jgi:hypothetical protein
MVGLECATGGRDPDRGRCPMTQDPPESAIGQMAEAIARRAGVWTRMGDMAALTGLNWSAVAVLFPPDLTASQHTVLLDALGWIEAGAVEGDGQRVAEAAASRKGGDTP